MTEAEQVLAMAHDGVTHLAEQTGLTEAEVARLVEVTRNAVPAEVAAEFARPVDSGIYGRGALPPRPVE